MTAEEIVEQLKPLGKDTYKKVLLNHGIKEPSLGFVIAVGSYVQALTDVALQIGAKIGPVAVDMGGTACKVPYAPDYIQKVQKRGAVGKKRKTTKC